MSLNTYDNLKTTIAAWIDDASVDAYIPDAIKIAEVNIRDRLKPSVLEVRATAPLPTDSRFMAFPAGFEQIVRIQLNTTPVTVLRVLPPTMLVEKLESSTGKPLYFANADGQIEFNRVPDSAYTAEMVYYEFKALSDTNASNGILLRYPNIYLYESLVAMAGFVDEEETKVAKWERQLEKAYVIAERAQKRKRFGGSMLRTRPDINHP